ncbi:hypothetical protein ACFV4N_38330, partial [Actinosynnema sp. NPDC059797]
MTPNTTSTNTASPNTAGPNAVGPNAVGTEAANPEAQALAAAHAHGPGRVVEPGPSPRPDPMPGPRVPLTALAAHGPFGAALARLLTDVATPLRWEPWNQYNDHRAYPSARAAGTVDLVLAVGARRWPLDPVRRALVGHAPPALDGPARVELGRR